MSVFASLAPLIDEASRRQVRRFRAGWIAVALLDASAIALVFPLAQALASPDGELSGAPSRLMDLTGVRDESMFAVLLAATIFSAFTTKSVLALLFLRSNLGTIHRLEVQFADRLIRGYLNAPWTFHLRRTAASIQRTFNEGIRRVFELGLGTELPAAGDRVVLGLIGLVLLVLAPLPTLAVAVYIAVAGRWYVRFSRAAAGASSAELLRRHEESTRFIEEALASTREITLTDTGDHFARRLHDVRVSIADRQRVLNLFEQTPRYYLELGLLIAVAIVAAVAFSTSESDAAVGAIGLFLAAGFRGLPSLNRLLVSRTHGAVALPHLEQILEDLRDTEGVFDQGHRDADPLRVDEPLRQLDLERVGFRYPDAVAPALDSVSFDIEPGTFVGIVGHSGAGKSTLIGLLLGLLDPTNGRMTVNGRDLTTCRRSYQDRLGYVPQEVVVLHGTIRENVAFGVPTDEIDDDAVWSALHAAELDALVRSLPHQLDAVTGERGKQLSGGQRQRLGLARALYRSPEVLVLDEATSSLDTETEQKILATLHKLERKLSVISVAHRPSAVRKSDVVHLLKDGRLLDSGSFDHLAASNEYFGRLMALDDDSELLEPGAVAARPPRSRP